MRECKYCGWKEDPSMVNKWMIGNKVCNQCFQDFEEAKSELEKCVESPYYFATNWMTVNGKPFTTLLTEEEFNERVFELQHGISRSR